MDYRNNDHRTFLLTITVKLMIVSENISYLTALQMNLKLFSLVSGLRMAPLMHFYTEEISWPTRNIIEINKGKTESVRKNKK